MLASNAIKRGHGQQKINVEANEINFDVKSKPLHVASASLCICHSRWLRRCILNRVRPRLFDQDGHETMYASSRSVHFFTKLCHRQTYQNYKQPPQTSHNLYFQSHFSVLKIG